MFHIVKVSFWDFEKPPGVHMKSWKGKRHALNRWILNVQG